MSDDKRKFKLSVNKAKTKGGTDWEKVELPFEIELGDKKEVDFTDQEIDVKGTKFKVSGKVKKGYMWDSIEGLKIVASDTTTTTLEEKSVDYKAEQMRWMPWTIPGILIILGLIGGAIWYFMSSNNEEEKEEEGL